MSESNIVPFPGPYKDETGETVIQIEGSFADFFKEMFGIDISDDADNWYVTENGDLLAIANDL